ncbi:protein LAX PANICLE 2-like [Cucurbita maxima]|uniref:Protein LAX PANICLE 2-like n=1 Tax=Cucurbita maxima TaxID=3661 RepID=A0A6J1I8S9_CUCMA|nr:protein LAX PANICLE 2-like [Cucurbita maxima]
MTMLPARTRLSQHHPSGGSYVGGCGGDHLMNAAPPLISENYYYCYSHPYLIALHPPMADDDSTTNSFNEEPPSNRDDGWLQLSIGRGRPGRTSNLVELDLLPGGGGDNPTAATSRDFFTPEAATTARSETGMQLFFGTPTSSNFVQQEINWAFRPMSAASPSSSFLPVGGRRSSYLGGPFIQFQSSGVQAGGAGPSSDVRIINPPRRPHSGIWFTLKALENQSKHPFLPQISKNYLRIKDEKMTVRLVMKYLVSKLHLDSESEIEIRCRGQEVEPFWTLQHVRDSIWTASSSSSDSLFTLLPHSSPTHHLMLLHYGRKP